jgi:hypothetical protein
MVLARRYPLSSSVVLAAFLAAASVFLFARPQFRPATDVENVNLAAGPRLAVVDVRKAFAAQNIALSRQIRGAGDGTTWLGQDPPPWPENSLYVIVFPQKGTLGLGHGEWEDAYYEERVGNVLVHYGGADAAKLARVKAAVADLRLPLVSRGWS